MAWKKYAEIRTANKVKRQSKDVLAVIADGGYVYKAGKCCSHEEALPLLKDNNWINASTGRRTFNESGYVIWHVDGSFKYAVEHGESRTKSLGILPKRNKISFILFSLNSFSKEKFICKRLHPPHFPK